MLVVTAGLLLRGRQVVVQQLHGVGGAAVHAVHGLLPVRRAQQHVGLGPRQLLERLDSLLRHVTRAVHLGTTSSSLWASRHHRWLLLLMEHSVNRIKIIGDLYQSLCPK